MEQTNGGGSLARPRSIPFQPFGKVTAIEIVLDRHDGPNGYGVYWPGDQLAGHVRLELNQRLTVKNIDLLVQGTGSVNWRQRNPQGGEEICSDDEVYLNDIAELVAKRMDEMVTLSAGEHIFPFACDLPIDLPATLTGGHGNVAYLVKVVIQADKNEPAHSQPCIATNLFLLESRLAIEGFAEYLNGYRIDYKHPVKTSALVVGSSAVKVALFLPRRAYDIGDRILVNMSLTNTSKKAVKKMSLELVMEITYQANGKTINEHLLIADHVDQFTVRHSESRQWRHVGMLVPRYIPPTGLPHSTLMSVKYGLVFKAEIEHEKDCASIYTPVLIGLDLPDEIKLSAPDSDSPLEVAAGGSQASSSRVIYRGSREPSFPLTFTSSKKTTTTNEIFSPSSTASAIQRPLYIDTTKLERPPLKQQPPQLQRQPQMQPQLQTQYLQPQASQTHLQPSKHYQHQQQLQKESDSQVISMKFTDELDDHSPYDHHAKVSRNPLFVPDTEPNSYYSNGEVYEQRNQRPDSNDHMIQAMGASLNNGVEEVLY